MECDRSGFAECSASIVVQHFSPRVERLTLSKYFRSHVRPVGLQVAIYRNPVSGVGERSRPAVDPAIVHLDKIFVRVNCHIARISMRRGAPTRVGVRNVSSLAAGSQRCIYPEETAGIIVRPDQVGETWTQLSGELGEIRLAVAADVDDVGIGPVSGNREVSAVLAAWVDTDHNAALGGRRKIEGSPRPAAVSRPEQPAELPCFDNGHINIVGCSDRYTLEFPQESRRDHAAKLVEIILL